MKISKNVPKSARKCTLMTYNKGTNKRYLKRVFYGGNKNEILLHWI